MAKTYLNQAKYIVRMKFEVNGVVDKHDIIGAIFGQSEGLVGEDLDLRELQSSGRIGRIEINLESENGTTKGELILPSSTDIVETSILAAMLEVVDKVGPFEAKFETISIDDVRNEKRKMIVERARDLLKKVMSEQIPDSAEIIEKVREIVKMDELSYYGEEKIPCGPDIEKSNEIILVEGRADVLNLLKYNIKNVIAFGGAKIPKSIVELTKTKTVTVFIDGDRGGELNLKRLMQMADVDYVARAPEGKEVEELTRKEIVAALRKKIPANAYFSTKENKKTKSKKQKEEKVEIKEEELIKNLESIKYTSKARLFNKEGNLLKEVPVRYMVKILEKEEDVVAIVFDGIITKRLLDLSKEKGIKYLVGRKVENTSIPEGVQIIVEE